MIGQPLLLLSGAGQREGKRGEAAGFWGWDTEQPQDGVFAICATAWLPPSANIIGDDTVGAVFSFAAGRERTDSVPDHIWLST